LKSPGLQSAFSLCVYWSIQSTLSLYACI
jgi:hypothetical protein